MRNATFATGTLAKVSTLLVLSAVLGGCMSFNPRSLRQMENALRDSNPELEFASTMKFGLGPLTMDMVDFAFVHDRSFDLSKISRADIGIYELKERFVIEEFQMPLTEDRSCPQREVILRVVEEDEHVEMAVCIRGDKIVGFAMFVLEPKEIVVINARGDLQAVVSAMIRDNVNRKARRESSRVAEAPPSPVAAVATYQPAVPAS